MFWIFLFLAAGGAYALGARTDPNAALRRGGFHADVPGQTVVMQVGRPYRMILSFPSFADAAQARGYFERKSEALGTKGMLRGARVYQQGSRSMLELELSGMDDTERIPIGSTIRITRTDGATALGTVQSIASLDDRPLDFFLPAQLGQGG